MAQLVYENYPIYLTRFVGPAREDGGDRTMYQLTHREGGIVQLTPAQLAALGDRLAAMREAHALH